MPLTPQQMAEMDAVLANRGAIKTPAGMIPFDGIPAVDMDSFGDMSGGMQRPPAAPSSLTPDMMAEMDAVLADSGKAPSKDGVAVGDVNDTLIPREWRAASYGISGGQIPFGNVLTSGIGAGIAKAASPITGDTRTYGELYNQAQADTKAVQEESPWASAAGNVVGALTTLPAVFSKGGQSPRALGQALTTGSEKATEYAGKMAGFSPFADKGLGAAGNVLTRYVGRSAVAAPVTGAYFAGEADAGNRGEAFGTGTLVGAGAAAALPVAGAIVGKIVNKAVTPSSKMIGEASSDLFKSGLAKGAKFSVEAADELVNAASSLRTVDPYAKAATGADEMDAITKKLIAAKKHPMTLDSYEVLDKEWGSLGHQASIAGKHDLARKYDVLQSKLRDIATNDKFVVGPTKDGIADYQKAVKLWAIRSKLRDIEQIEEFAKYYVGGEASGIKSGYARLAKSNKIYKFSPEEVKMITKAAKTGNTEGLLRTLGSRLMVIGGAVKGGPAGAAAAYAASQAARGGASALKGIESGRIGKSIADKAVEIAPNLAKKPSMPPALTQKVANALGVSRAGISGNSKAAQFLKDYIADESGSLGRPPENDKIVEDNTKYFIQKIKELGGNVRETSKSKNRNGDFSNYVDFSLPNTRLMNARISDHLSNDKFNTSSVNLINSTKDDIDNIINKLKASSAEYGEKIKLEKQARLESSIRQAAQKKQAYSEQISGLEKKINEARKKGYGQTFDRIPEMQAQINKIKSLLDKSGALKIIPDEKIKLYRGLQQKYDPNFNMNKSDAPTWYSTWTDNPDLARQYAGNKGYVYYIELPKAQLGNDLIDVNGERALFVNNQKKAGLNNVSGEEFLLYHPHDYFSPNMIKEFKNKK